MEDYINPQKYYNPSEISRQGLFPWIQHPRSILNWLKKQVEIGNGDKWEITVISQENTKYGNRYFVKGTGLIKIRASFDDGSL